MDRKTKGRLGEAKVLAELIERGYEIYTPFNDNTKFDMLGYKDNKLVRISVKFTSSQLPSGSWDVTMKSVSRRNNGQVNVSNFNSEEFDIVAVYIHPEDRVVLIPAGKVGKTSVAVPAL